jgi:DNA primase small subunit
MTGSKIDTTTYLKNRFREYYTTHGQTIETPPSFEQREFGFLPFETKTMYRHIAFQTPNTMRNYLKTNAPAHVYYSSAYYETPEAEMENKGWLGADLVFDIDADHLETPCKKQHDQWTCENCGTTGRGATPESCPKCGKTNLTEETWFCEKCLEAAKSETLKLLDILIQDLGFSSKDIDINFSGNRGYHVHIYQEEARQLDQLARREIVDYIRGIGIEAQLHALGRTQEKSPALSGTGWSGRLARALYSFLDVEPEHLEDLGLSSKVTKNLLEKREEVLESLRGGSANQVLRLFGPKDQSSLDKLVTEAARREAAAIDTVVTADVHRLIRLPITLHGKTGLKAEKSPVNSLEGFDPLKSAIAFDRGEITVHVLNAPEFRIGDETFGPFMDKKVDLPASAAILLLCKGAARVVT